MGEYAEQILDGECCALCGEYFEEDAGYPCVCVCCYSESCGYVLHPSEEK